MRINKIFEEEFTMKKFTEWTKKPITWGGYFKFAGVMTLISVLITGATYVFYFWDEVSTFFTNKFEQVKNLVKR